MRRRRRRTRYRVINIHHVEYTPPKTVLLFRSEHNVVTRLGRLAKSVPSAAFLELTSQWVSMMRLKSSLSEAEMFQRREENWKKLEALNAKKKKAA